MSFQLSLEGGWTSNVVVKRLFTECQSHWPTVPTIRPTYSPVINHRRHSVFLGCSFRRFHQMYNFGAVGHKDKLIRFWDRKVKGQRSRSWRNQIWPIITCYKCTFPLKVMPVTVRRRRPFSFVMKQGQRNNLFCKNYDNYVTLYLLHSIWFRWLSKSPLKLQFYAYNILASVRVDFSPYFDDSCINSVGLTSFDWMTDWLTYIYFASFLFDVTSTCRWRIMTSYITISNSCREAEPNMMLCLQHREILWVHGWN